MTLVAIVVNQMITPLIMKLNRSFDKFGITNFICLINDRSNMYRELSQVC